MTITRPNPDTLPKNPAFTQVITVPSSANLIYVGGQNAVNIQGEIVGDTIGVQAEQAFRNVIAALEAAGATLQDIIKMTIYLVHGQSLQEAFGAAQRVQAMSINPPTVSVIMVAGLANPRFLIEIEAVAALDTGEK